MAQTYNGTIDQGADWYLTAVYRDPYGDPIDLTGYSAALQLRSTADSTTTVLSLTSASGITITGFTGTIQIHATAAQTRAIPAGVYFYDLEITSGGGIVTRLIQGTQTVSAEVTR